MPNKTDEIIAEFEKLLRAKRGATFKPTDRLGIERVPLSREFQNEPMPGYEKAAAILGAALSPGSTIASLALAPPAEETIFDRQIKGPDGKLTILPSVSEGAVPRFKKAQRKAIETLAKFPTKPDYLSGAGSRHYSEAAKVLGAQVPRTAPRKGDFTGTTYNRRGGPEMDITEYSGGDPVGRLRFDEDGKVTHAGVLPSQQGKGIGKELYKKAAMMGRNIYELGQTSQDAAKARYAALQDLAKGKFPDKPVKVANVPAQKAMAAGAEVRPATDWNRMQYLQELTSLQKAAASGEITPAGYNRARQILDSGEYREVSRAVRERAESEPSNMNMRILELLDYLPK